MILDCVEDEQFIEHKRKQKKEILVYKFLELTIKNHRNPKGELVYLNSLKFKYTQKII